MTSVAFVSPAHGRFAVTALVLAQRRRLIRELAGRGIDATSIIVADDKNLDIAIEYGCQTVEVPNLPLGQKCNSGLHAAAKQADYVVWVGSDDWIHADVFDTLPGTLPRLPMRIVTGRRMAIVDLARGRLQRISSPSKFGAIPWILDSRLLRTNRRELVRPDLNRGLDGALIRGLNRARIRFEFVMHDPHDFRCVDFKTRENITPYRGLAKHLGTATEERAWDALTEWFPADLVDLARITDLGGKRIMKMMNPATGELSSVSTAGAKVLRSRGWTVPGESPTPAAADWPNAHAKLDEIAADLGVTFPEPPEGKTKLTVAEKITALEAAGHTPPES